MKLKSTFKYIVLATLATSVIATPLLLTSCNVVKNDQSTDGDNNTNPPGDGDGNKPGDGDGSGGDNNTPGGGDGSGDGNNPGGGDGGDQTPQPPTVDKSVEFISNIDTFTSTTDSMLVTTDSYVFSTTMNPSKMSITLQSFKADVGTQESYVTSNSKLQSEVVKKDSTFKEEKITTLSGGVTKAQELITNYSNPNATFKNVTSISVESPKNTNTLSLTDIKFSNLSSDKVDVEVYLDDGVSSSWLNIVFKLKGDYYWKQSNNETTNKKDIVFSISGFKTDMNLFDLSKLNNSTKYFNKEKNPVILQTNSINEINLNLMKMGWKKVDSSSQDKFDYGISELKKSNLSLYNVKNPNKIDGPVINNLINTQFIDYYLNSSSIDKWISYRKPQKYVSLYFAPNKNMLTNNQLNWTESSVRNNNFATSGFIFNIKEK